MLYDILIWLHLLCMIGAFGGLLHWHAVGEPFTGSKTVRLASILVAAGFLIGLVMYFQKIKMGVAAEIPVTSHQHMLVGIKFTLLFVLGALLGIASKKLKQDKPAGPFIVGSLVIMAAASLLGVLV